MTSFHFRVNKKNKYDIELLNTTQDTLVEINGHKTKIRVVKIDDSQFILKINDKKYKTYCAKNNDVWYINIDNHNYLVEQSQQAARSKNKVASDEDVSLGELRAQMPGKVIQIYVHENEHVSKGQKLMAIEAMKMEHKILAPYNGILKKLNYNIGDVVGTGEPLLELCKDVENEGAT